MAARRERCRASAPKRHAHVLQQDRKSTRLNSSHSQISYAVFHPALHSFPTRRSSDLSPPESRAAPIQTLAARRSRRRSSSRAKTSSRCGHRPMFSIRANGCSTRALSRFRSKAARSRSSTRSEEHTSELQSQSNLVCRLPPSSTLFPYTTLFRSEPPGVAGGPDSDPSCPAQPTTFQLPCEDVVALWAPTYVFDSSQWLLDASAVALPLQSGTLTFFNKIGRAHV